jgi:hypothetical protein
MAISRDLLKLVPVGEENAVSGLLLWKQLNMWSPASIKHNLQQMADDGVIERKRVRRGPHETNLYFRSRIEGPAGAIAFPPSARSGWVVQKVLIVKKPQGLSITSWASREMGARPSERSLTGVPSGNERGCHLACLHRPNS